MILCVISIPCATSARTFFDPAYLELRNRLRKHTQPVHDYAPWRGKREHLSQRSSDTAPWQRPSKPPTCRMTRNSCPAPRPIRWRCGACRASTVETVMVSPSIVPCLCSRNGCWSWTAACRKSWTWSRTTTGATANLSSNWQGNQQPLPMIQRFAMRWKSCVGALRFSTACAN